MNKQLLRLYGVLFVALSAVLAFFSTRSFLAWRRSVHSPGYQPGRMPASGISPVSEAVPHPESIEAGEEIKVVELVRPLVEHLLGFHTLISTLRYRRRASGAKANTGARSLTPGDRYVFQETLGRLQRMVPNIADKKLLNGSLQERILRLMGKVFDAFQNLDYNDDDLIRIDRDLRPEACRVMKEIQSRGDAPGIDLDPVMKRYDCR
jgi:hypothetical protein